jgi:alpha,alpha-trehalose phosphorylase
LTIYRHQVLKQADTVLAYTLVETDEDIMKRSFDYYEALTTHDSSLSKCIYGIMAARLGDLDKAYRYFLESLRLDVYDTQGNTRDGLHMANVAGALLSILTGFAGLRVKSDRLILRPKLPRQLDGYRFKIHYRDRLIKLSVADEYQLELLQGDPVDVEINGRNYTLANQLEGAVT